MLKKLVWIEDSVFSVRLEGDLFTLCQMRRNSLMQFFDIKSKDGKWRDVDLNVMPQLFCIFLAENKIKSLLEEKLEVEVVKPNRRPIPRRMLRAIIGNNGTHGAKLVELTDTFSGLDARVVKPSLSIAADLGDIYAFELTGMVGNSDKLKTRLVRYFESGINWDESKEFLFKGIRPPAPRLSVEI